MNNKRTWIIILTASLLLVGTVSLVAILQKKENNKGGVNGSGGQTMVNPVETDDTSSEGGDTTQPTLTGVINQSSSGVDSCYIKSSERARYGFYTDRLKSNMKYRLEWSIDPTIFDEFPALSFCQSDGKDSICYSVNYIPNSSFVSLFSDSTDKGVYYNNSCEFTSGNEGAVFAIFFMESAIADDSTMVDLCFAMEEAVVFQIYEIS